MLARVIKISKKELAEVQIGTALDKTLKEWMDLERQQQIETKNEILVPPSSVVRIKIQGLILRWSKIKKATRE